MARQAKSSFESKNRGWYLLLHLGVPDKGGDFSLEKHFEIVTEACNQISVKIRPFDLYYGDGDSSIKRYLFTTLACQRDDALATRFAESFIYAMSLTSYPLIEPSNDSLFLWIPEQMIQERTRITTIDLILLEKSRSPYERTVFPTPVIGNTSTTTHYEFELAWRVTPIIFLEERFFRAVGFYKCSRDDFHVYPGQIPDVIAEPDISPRSGSEQSRFETALQNAFKAVEAIIGDPPRDDRKFFDKLEAIGLDPHEEVGWGIKEPLHSVVRKMNLARDKRAAHGSTSERSITVGELLNFQACAHYIVTAELEKLLGETFSY